jgi:hypothetical protein
MTKEIHECATACLDAHRSALMTLKVALRRGNGHSETTHLLRLLDCAQLCHTCAEFCLDESAECAPVAQACAKVCEGAALVCERYEDRQLRQCAEVLRYCARSCYRVVHAVPA